MDYKISIINGLPVWDALPVGKIIHYPLEKRDYRPFAQVRLCANETDLYLRMWAFETRPSPKSVLMARLNFDSAKLDKYLQVRVDSMGGMTACAVDGETETPLAQYLILPELHCYRGEDLEGEYWGVVVKIPRLAVEKIWGKDPIAANYVIRGNVYKEDTAEKTRHLGSLFPVDLEKDEPFGKNSFGSMMFVNY